MNRLIFALLTALFLSSCGGSGEPSEVTRIVEQVVEATVIVERSVEVTREVEVTKLSEVTRVVERVVTATSPPTPQPTATPEVILGERQSPVPLGETIELELGEIQFTVAVSNVIRGDEAYSQVLAWNQFNDDPFPEGMEHIIFRPQVTYTGSDQGPLELDWTDWSVFTAGRIIDPFFGPTVVVDDEFEVILFAGGEGSGWLQRWVDIDDPQPLAVLGFNARDEAGVYFALYE